MFEPTITHWLDVLRLFIPWLIAALGTVIIAVLIFDLITRITAWRHQLRQKTILLELTPPAFADRSLSATDQLFAVLHSLGLPRNFGSRLLRRQNSLALEIVSTRATGIRFMIRAAEAQVNVLEQAIHAYLPEVRLREVKDYLEIDNLKKARVVRFKQAEHFAYPLASHDLLNDYDPMAYITSAMTKPAQEELIAFQMVIKPVRVPEAESLSHKILSNYDLLPRLKSHHRLFQKITAIINKVLLGVMDLVAGVFNGSTRTEISLAQRDLEHKKQVAQHIKPERTLSYFEQQLVESIHYKLAKPLFRTDIRILLVSGSVAERNRRLDSLCSALGQFNVPKYQTLIINRQNFYWTHRYRQFAFFKRLSSTFTTPNLLSSSEVSGLYHFPNSQTAKTENIVKSLSKTLPASVSLKDGTKLDIELGLNNHHGSSTVIGLTAEERQRHVYIIGGTGSGKTTMLLYSIIQDITNGKGLAVIDPHGDLAEILLRYIPPVRIKDVIYLNPDDLAHPIGINLLELPENATGDELLRQKDMITESTISVMRKIFSEDDTGGHRIEYILRNTIQTALTVKDATLFTIFRLLTDHRYQRSVVDNLEDIDLKNFWKNELARAGDFQRVKMAAGITAKIGRFLFSASAKRILEQPKSTINFDDILNTGKILICNFSKGTLGEDTSTLFGTTVLAKLQMASLKRARLNPADRLPFYLYVDEFQNFATMSFVQMLSEARKYKLFLIMAEQSTAQQEQQRLVDIILANVGTVICFRSGSPADERFVLPLFAPFIDSGEIAYLPAYNFYVRISAVQAQEPMSGTTILVNSPGSETVAEQVIDSSRLHSAIKYKAGPRVIIRNDLPPIGSHKYYHNRSQNIGYSIRHQPIPSKRQRPSTAQLRRGQGKNLNR